MWKSGEIDVAVVSAEVFKREPGILNDAVNCCTLTHNSGRGVRLIALYDPNKVADVARLKLEFPDEVIEKVATREYSGGKIIVPTATFGSAHVEKIDTEKSIVPHEIRLGDFKKFSDDVFRILEDNESGVIIVALWEPFVTYLRYEWQERMKSASPFDWLECSLSQTIDTKSSVGLPTLSMDVLVRKRYLNDAAGTPPELDHFLTNLQKVTSDLEDQIQVFRKTVSIIRSFVDDDADISGKLNGKTSKEIRTLALYYGISEYDCARAIAQVGFEIGYAPEYVQYLKKLIWRRSGGRESLRARLGEAA